MNNLKVTKGDEACAQLIISDIGENLEYIEKLDYGNHS
jgi:hypothetical protein